jgi:hypothetical protein
MMADQLSCYTCFLLAANGQALTHQHMASTTAQGSHEPIFELCRAMARPQTASPAPASLARAAEAAALHAFAHQLGKTGKPQQHEHTVMAAILLSYDPVGKQAGAIAVVALATGTKCLGGPARCLLGNLINDSHAEVKVVVVVGWCVRVSIPIQSVPKLCC